MDDMLIDRMSIYQNPYRLSEAKVWVTVRARDKFGARRVRSGGYISAGGHKGLDLPAAVGTRLFPLAVGRVTEIKDYQHPKSTYWRNGKAVEIKSAYGYKIKYLHLKKFRKGLKVGDPVDLDTVIGYVGISGNGQASNPHVHIQIRDPTDKVINPEPFIRQNIASGKTLRADLQASVQRNRSLYLTLFRKVEQRAL